MAVKKNKKEADSLINHVDEIKELAYQYYLKRMNTSSMGDSVEDWIMAEEEIKKKYKLK